MSPGGGILPGAVFDQDDNKGNFQDAHVGNLGFGVELNSFGDVESISRIIDIDGVDGPIKDGINDDGQHLIEGEDDFRDQVNEKKEKLGDRSAATDEAATLEEETELPGQKGPP